jgi:lysophospholipase L1-like esterase
MRGALRNLLLAAASIVLFFGAAEIFLRITGLAPARALRSPDLATLDAIPGLYEPGQEFTDLVRRDLPSRIRIDNLGFRGRDLALEKPPSTFRILCLGDSYTFGDHVDDDQTYPALLETDLRGRTKGPGVEVINAGVNGFGILDESIFWKEKGRRLRPDAVILTFSPNDISDLTRPALMISKMREHAALKSRPLVGAALRFLQDTALFNGMQILAARLSVAVRSHDTIPALEPSRAGPEAAPREWEAYHRALLDFAGEVRGARARGLLLLYPSAGNATGAERSFASSILPAWAREAGLECLDLLPDFTAAAARGETLFLVPRDAHPGPEGHRLAADRIAAWLLASGWLKAVTGDGPARPSP